MVHTITANSVVGIMALVVAALFGVGGYELAHVPLQLPPT